MLDEATKVYQLRATQDQIRHNNNVSRELVTCSVRQHVYQIRQNMTIASKQHMRQARLHVQRDYNMLTVTLH